MVYAPVPSPVVASRCGGIGGRAGRRLGGEQRADACAPVARRRSVHARGGIGRSDLGWCGAVDTAGAGPARPRRPRRHGVGSGHRRVRDRPRRGLPPRCRPWHRARDAHTGPQRAPGDTAVWSPLAGTSTASVPVRRYPPSAAPAPPLRPGSRRRGCGSRSPPASPGARATTRRTNT